jgi:hypothetical protein
MVAVLNLWAVSHEKLWRESMRSAPGTVSSSNKSLWAGRIVSGLAVLFLLFDAVMKLLKLAPAVAGTTRLGYPESVVAGIGILELACTVVYVIPASSVLGAILMTGYLGGAVATHVRVGDPLFTHILFPVYVGLLIWGGIFLRELRLRALVPFRNPS